jgi:hypothetical protein
MKDFKIYIIVASILLGGYLFMAYNKPGQSDWTPSLSYTDKIPYGTYIIYHQLNQIFPGAKIIRKNTSVYTAMHNPKMLPGSYILIAKTVDINKYDFKEMVNYMKAGNSVFISCFNLKGFITDTLNLNVDFEYTKKNTRQNFVNNQIKTDSGYTFNRDMGDQYFSTFDTVKATVIAKNNNDHSTYLSFKFGKGNLYICTNPCVFTNYSLLTGNGADYAAKALFQNGDVNEQDESPLRVFFSNPNLQWAYYLGLCSLLIFVLFEMKRRQRIIPVIEPLKNSTLDFVTVVGQVYYEKRNNADIAHKKILYLLTYLRDKYQVRTTKLDTEFTEKLIEKLGLDPKFANELVNHLQYVSLQGHVNDNELIELNKLIEQFYIQSR